MFLLGENQCETALLNVSSCHYIVNGSYTTLMQVGKYIEMYILYILCDISDIYVKDLN
jgi:nicotinamide riboside transporter PnuC